MTPHSLDGTWQFRVAGRLRGAAPRDRGLDRWMPCAMPGTIHFTLQKLGKIADPYYGRNELAVQWIDEQDWELRRTVRASAADCARNRQELVFDGLDTVATVTVNDRVVGRSVNMFRQVVCDVRGALKPGENEVRVRLASPTAYTAAEAERHHHRTDSGKGFGWSTGEQRASNRVWIRKVQCHFGWDWGVYLATSGIWQPSRLECADGPRFASLVTAQEHRGPVGAPTSVRLHVTARLAATAAGAGTLVVACGGATVRVPARLRPGENAIVATLTVNAPKLWWPAGQGEQNLYELFAVWEDAAGGAGPALARRLGLRTLDLITKPDRTADGKPAESFCFRINGRDVYAKGADWIPADQYVDRCTPAVYRHLLSSMVEANMNMVRVWGGGWYEQDSFYDLCDELGLMVWQDFMMACGIVPDHAAFQRELAAEARYQVRRLRNHACLALWCGDNENAECIWGTWYTGNKKQRHNVVLYTHTMRRLKQVCEAEDPTRRFWLSSPSNNEFGGVPCETQRGDAHYWAVWHGRQPFSNYLTVKPRFASEFGFQSFPEPRTIAAAVPKDQLNPSSRVMEHHQRAWEGNQLIVNTIAREMPIPKDFASFCWVSQIDQALAIRTAVEHWRRLKPWCMGALYWQLNDLWPVASWASIDWHGRWKALHHAAGRFFAPLLVSVTQEKGVLTVWATSDLPRPLRLAGALELFAWSGKRVARLPLKARLAANESRAIASVPVTKLLKGRAEPHEVCGFVRLSGDGAKAENFVNLVPWKWATLPRPAITAKLSQSRKGISLTVASQQVAPFFHAELTGLEGHFAGDWQVLRPGQTYVMPWVPHRDRGAEMPTLSTARKLLDTFSLYDTFAH